MPLSFIFPHGHRQHEKNLCKYINDGYCLPGCSIPVFAPLPSSQTIFELLFELLLELHQNKEIEINQPEVPNMAKEVIMGFNNHFKQWNSSHNITENQFSEQAVFSLLLPAFLFKHEYEISKYDKAMICDSAYKPDLLILLNLPNKKQIDFFTCEIKKPFGNLCNQMESDYVKIHKEMKLIIDAQIDLGVQRPIAFSLLVEGYNLTLFKMTLEYDGEYRSIIVAKCRTVRDHDDSLLLYHGISMMLHLETELSKLKDEICNEVRGRNKRVSPALKLRRPSFGKAIKADQRNASTMSLC